MVKNILKSGETMDKTKIEWADATWNPVTGCLNGCKYCYAKRIAERFGGSYIPRGGQKMPVLDEPVRTIHRDGKSGKIIGKNISPYPYGFTPTFHRYRLDIPERWTKPRTIFVCSMADLFGGWVPFKWIADVFDACMKAPQHRYLFLTKNAKRYSELEDIALLPHGANYWYGTSVTSKTDAESYAGDMEGIVNTFWSMEPLLGPVNMSEAKETPGWVILGAETGNRKNKVIPKKEWIDSIVEFCDAHGVPVLMKDSLIPVVGAENMRRDFPWTK